MFILSVVILTAPLALAQMFDLPSDTSVDWSTEFELGSDEEGTVLNAVILDHEKTEFLTKSSKLMSSIPVLPARDVKCLVSMNEYCTREMKAMKKVLISAFMEDCRSCSEEDKKEAGKVMVSLMAHNPIAWKVFITRYDGLGKLEGSPRDT